MGIPASIAAGVLVGVSSAVNVVSVVTSGAGIGDYLRYIFQTIFVSVGIKKRTKPWGVIYNAQTKEPIPFAKVELLNREMRVIESRRTDQSGRYGFLPEEQTLSAEIPAYFMRAAKAGFLFPSVYMTASEDPPLYHALYRGEALMPHDGIVNADIPMDPAVPAPLVRKGLPQRFLHNAFVSLANFGFWAGFVITPANYVITPTRFNLGVLIAVAALDIVRIVGDIREKPYGVIKDGEGHPVPYTLITMTGENGERIGFAVSDSHGRYFLLGGRGISRITLSTPADVMPPRSREETITAKHGWIAKSFML